MVSHDDLWALIRRVPAGRVVAYGDLGKTLPNPVSGLIVGRWLKSSPEDVPWWRVVGKDGSLPIAKQSPALALEQTSRLEAEGIKFEGDRISTVAFISIDELSELNY